MIKSLGFLNELSLPVIVAPMFLVSGPELVTACCRSGVVGSFPFPNARKLTTLDKWLFNINKNLSDSNVPYAVNLTTHKTYDRLEEELILSAEKCLVKVIAPKKLSNCQVTSSINGKL